MDSIRPTLLTSSPGGPQTRVATEEGAPAPQGDSVVIGGGQAAPPQIPPRVAAAEAPPAPPAPPPAQTMPPEAPQGFVNVPVTLAVPIELVTPDAQGNVPVSQYKPSLLPPGAIVTSEKEVQDLVATIKRQTLPPGTHPEIDPSPLGRKLDIAAKTLAKVGGSIGTFATASLAYPGAWMTLSHGIAGPLAMVTGPLSIISGLSDAKESANLSGYYQGLKAEGVTSLPMPGLVQTDKGPQMGVVEEPIDKLIGQAKDKTVVGSAQALAGALALAAGACALAAVPGVAALAIGSIVIGVAGAMYMARGALAPLFKGMFHRGGGEAQQQAQQQKQEPQVAPPGAGGVEGADSHGRIEPTFATPPKPNEQPQG